MIRIDGDRLLVEGPVTLDTVPAIAGEAVRLTGSGVAVVDLAGVTDVDSSAVALTLEWLRQAELSGRTLRVANMPDAMRNLAALYGVSEFLVAS